MAQTIFCDVAECQLPADVMVTMTNGSSTDAFCSSHYQLAILALADVIYEARELAETAVAEQAAAEAAEQAAAASTEAPATEDNDDVPETEQPTAQPAPSKRAARAATVGS